MASDNSAFRKGMAKVFLYPLLSLLLLPALSWWFVGHALPEYDRQILEVIDRNIGRRAGVSPEEKAAIMGQFRAVPPSKACGTRDPELQRYRDSVCKPYETVWQFRLVQQMSFWAMVVGIAVLAVSLALGGLAFLNRKAQHWSFLLGWRMLTVVSAAEVLVQGALAVWLSFWLTAFFFERYYIKLILIVGLAVAAAAFYAVVCIFKRVPDDTGVEGEALADADAPALWAHVRAIAERLKTKAPDHIVAGIDTNFFVTEAPLVVNGQTLTGRTLFVSLPLLRVLDRHEADAVLGHELAHLRGGDTASSAALGPMLVRYDHYAQAMGSNPLTVFVYYLLRLYRVIFEFALRRDSRAREFLADRIAAKLTSPAAIAQSLVKISAYARYRADTERKLFEHEHQHGDDLGIAGRVAAGLTPYATSAEFVEDMKSASVPHPFDSHPPLPERMAQVGHHIAEEDYGRVASAPVLDSWIADIATAAAIEQRLWAAYEQGFAAAHERNLAYRYEPADETQAAVVLKYFPPVAFALKADERIEIHYAGLRLPGQADTLPWDKVANLKYEDGMGADVLTIVHPEKGWLGAKTTKVKLPGIKKEREQFKGVLGHYWQRHQVMRSYQAGA
jgi:Zn-dependent protease with chaperone function